MVRSQVPMYWYQKPAPRLWLEICSEGLQVGRAPKGKPLYTHCRSKQHRDPWKQRKIQSAKPAGIAQRSNTFPNRAWPLPAPLLCCGSYFLRIRVMKTWFRVAFLSIFSSAISLPLSQMKILRGHLFKFIVGTHSYVHFIQAYSPAFLMP